MDFSGEIIRNSPIPFYYQFQGILQTQIKEAGLPPETQLPSESELCEKYRVSRTVVRAALFNIRSLFKKRYLELEAIIVCPPETDLLKVQAGSPAMFVNRTTYDSKLQPFEYTRCIYRGDRYRFVSSLQK